jgi:hypothetical protein
VARMNDCAGMAQRQRGHLSNDVRAVGRARSGATDVAAHIALKQASPRLVTPIPPRPSACLPTPANSYVSASWPRAKAPASPIRPGQRTKLNFGASAVQAARLVRAGSLPSSSICPEICAPTTARPSMSSSWPKEGECCGQEEMGQKQRIDKHALQLTNVTSSFPQPSSAVIIMFIAVNWGYG